MNFDRFAHGYSESNNPMFQTDYSYYCDKCEFGSDDESDFEFDGGNCFCKDCLEREEVGRCIHCGSIKPSHDLEQLEDETFVCCDCKEEYEAELEQLLIEISRGEQNG